MDFKVTNQMNVNGTIQNRSIHGFYFPVHWLEPFDDNEENLDYDLLSSSIQRTAIESALSTSKPSLTSRFAVSTPTLRAIVEEPPEGVVSYGVVLVHPGIPDPLQPEQEAKMWLFFLFILRHSLKGLLRSILHPWLYMLTISLSTANPIS
ncbi:phosphorelay sensor kinase [Fragilaria crotonensis]|nr:phosphorelay sensor kinase [Fragilaria crotonensis]